ncbi:hypothetical protein [Streptomyces lutosisoli]|uniref:Uncharacterized protein n=1 Tax=Streptomyces lutosisoli TaxID=2665721 RepID=A0ABW2VY38_9ACTN
MPSIRRGTTDPVTALGVGSAAEEGGSVSTSVTVTRAFTRL